MPRPHLRICPRPARPRLATGFVLVLAGLWATTALTAQEVVQITVQAPTEGPFWAVGPLPIDTPEHLVGPSGVSAHRLETLGDHNAIYGVEAHGDALQAGSLRLQPADADYEPAAWSTHPAVLAAASTMFGQVRIRELESLEPDWTRTQEGPFRNRFVATHDLGEYWLRLWFDVFARSPVVHVVGFVARKDRAAEQDVPFKLAFGAQVAFPLERHHGGRLRATTNAIQGRIDLERAGLYPLRCTLLFGGRDPARSDDQPAPELDSRTTAALRAGLHGPRWFMPAAWRGEWLGVVPRAGTAACHEIARQGLAKWQSNHAITSLRPWASMCRAGQGGSQPSLGLAWWAPALVDVSLHPHEVHLWSAEDWALRPVHLFEPGTADPIADVLKFGGTVAHRQIHEDVEIGNQELPRFQTHGVLPVKLPNGQTDQRSSHDEQHMADTPLIAAYALTGDPLVRWLLDSHRALDLASRQVARGWRSNGRGEGRTVASVLLAARTIGGEPLEQVKDWSLQRLEHAHAAASSAHLPDSAMVRPIHAYSDDRLNCRHPCLMTYEEAQVAWSSWLVWRATGDARALDAAYRFGLTTAAQLYQDGPGGAWRIPYAVWLHPDGEPLTEEQLRDPDLVHPTSWTILWSGSGLRALLNAAAAKDSTPAEHEPILARARAALRWLDAQPVTKIEEIHQALLGAAYAGG